MSAQILIEILQKTLVLHKSLNQLAKQKTEIIKKGDTVTLQSLLKDEKKHIQAIRKFEMERMKVSKDLLFKSNPAIDNPTISDCIGAVNNTEKQKLMDIKSELETQIVLLAEQNELNQLMIEQSLQFVNLSLDLLIPDIDTFNYERPGQANYYEDGRSIFNSKA